MFKLCSNKISTGIAGRQKCVFSKILSAISISSCISLSFRFEPAESDTTWLKKKTIRNIHNKKNKTKSKQCKLFHPFAAALFFVFCTLYIQIAVPPTPATAQCKYSNNFWDKTQTWPTLLGQNRQRCFDDEAKTPTSQKNCNSGRAQAGAIELGNTL